MKATLAACVFLAAGSAAALGSVSLVTSRAALPSDDFIDWGQFGSNGQSVTNPSNGTTNSTLGFQIRKPGGAFQRLDAGTGWGGGFTNGDRLIFAIADNAMTVEFDSPVTGAGMQIWRNFPGTPINVQIDAFDANGGLLGSFADVPTGGGGAPNNNQAAFIGVLSDRADIKRVVYTVSGAGGTQEFSGNRMDLVLGEDCYPDCDTSTGKGNLDIFDFLCFQNRYDAGAPYACDCDLSTGPNTCDIFDFLCFQNAYDKGCP